MYLSCSISNLLYAFPLLFFTHLLRRRSAHFLSLSRLLCSFLFLIISILFFSVSMLCSSSLALSFLLLHYANQLSSALFHCHALLRPSFPIHFNSFPFRSSGFLSFLFLRTATQFRSLSSMLSSIPFPFLFQSYRRLSLPLLFVAALILSNPFRFQSIPVLSIPLPLSLLQICSSPFHGSSGQFFWHRYISFPFRLSPSPFFSISHRRFTLQFLCSSKLINSFSRLISSFPFLFQSYRRLSLPLLFVAALILIPSIPVTPFPSLRRTIPIFSFAVLSCAPRLSSIPSLIGS